MRNDGINDIFLKIYIPEMKTVFETCSCSAQIYVTVFSYIVTGQRGKGGIIIDGFSRKESGSGGGA